jgi:glycosyltransferase involved in cell wall biosynthesis
LGLHDRVHFIGEVDKIESLMADSDVFVLSTRYDSLPLSIIEAMRAGLPVIATGVGGIPELITHGFNGYVSRVADPCSLREALAPVIQSSQERRRMGQNGRARYERSFRLSTMFRKVLSLYRDAADTQSQEITMLLTPETTR